MAKKGLSDSQAITLALQEMNQGLPAGTYASAVQQLSQPTPTPQDEPQSWVDAINRLGAPPAPPVGDAMNQDWTDAQAVQQMQDKAQADQDRRLAQVFGMPAAKQNQLDTGNLPPAVDRYIEKILAS